MASINGGTLNRISGGIYRNALALHRHEHQELARWAAVVRFREKVAGLRDEIDARHVCSNAPQRFVAKAA
jgi:hypothetical protein